MKRFITISVLLITLITVNSCAKKGCTDKSAPNYNSSATKDDGSCINLTSSLVGVYTGTLTDSIIGSGIPAIVSDSEQVSIISVDDQTISVLQANGGTIQPFKAIVAAQANGYSVITIPSQTIGGGTITGFTAATINGVPVSADYQFSNRQFLSITTFVLNGDTYIESYQGTH